MNIYSATDLKNIIGNYETWGKLLDNPDWNTPFIQITEKRKIKYQTELNIVQIISVYNKYKKSNKIAGGLKGVENKFKNKTN